MTTIIKRTHTPGELCGKFTIMKNILVVEDTADIRESVAEILSLGNYNVEMAADGKEGLDKIHLRMPDLVISDIMMPVLDGIGMLRILRKDPKTEGIPFIFLTSQGDRNNFRAAMDTGADDYITKPFSGDELLKAVENRFRRIAIMQKSLTPDMLGLSELIEAHEGSLEQLPADHDTNSYQKKQVIYKEGHQPHFLYYIQQGKVRTYKTHEDGKQLVTQLYNEGDFLGYIALLEETAYHETAEAMEDTELTQIPRKDFETLLHKNPDVQEKVIKMLAKNIAEYEHHLLGIAYDTLRKKVANAFMYLQAKYHTDKSTPFVIDMARGDLAAIAGTATESLIRTLGEFKTEKLIKINPRDNKITILDAARIAKLLR